MSSQKDPSITEYTSPYTEYGFKKSDELGKGSGNYPYTVKTQMNNRGVEFVGMAHTNNLEDTSLRRMESQLNVFVHSAHDLVVFVEGGMRDVVDMTREEVITRWGEAGLITKLAKDNALPIESPEPPEEQEVAALLKIFTPGQIMQYYFARQLYQWYRNKNNNPAIGSAREYIDSLLTEYYGKTPGLEGTPMDYDALAAQFAEKCGGQRPEDMPDELAERKLHDESSPMNPVSEASSDIRDQYIFEQVQKVTKAGHNIFIVYGSHHAFVFEQMLQENSIEYSVT